MWAAIGLALKVAASGLLSMLRALPWWVYAVVAAVIVQWLLLSAAQAKGDRIARAELAPLLMQAHADAATRLQQAADAKGEVIAVRAGLDACIGQRVAMDAMTSAIINQREQQRAAAVRALNTTRQELAHAYSISADSCADQPVPAGVLQLLDRLSAPDPDADGERPGAAVRAGAGIADDSNASASTCWLDVPRVGGLDPGMVCGIAGLQRGQGEYRKAGG